MPQDYTTYSLAELREALGIVDERRYPENKAAIEAEIQARIDSGAVAEEERADQERQAAETRKKIEFARKARPYIAKYLIGTGAYVVVWNIIQPPTFNGFWSTAILALGLAYMLGTVISGVAILRSKGWGSMVAIGLLCVQLVEITSSAFSVKAMSALGFYVTLGANGDIGLSAEFQPVFSMAFGTSQPFTISVNLFVLWLISLLVKANRPGRQ